MEMAIEADALARSYVTRTGSLWRARKRSVDAVRGVSFAVPRGEAFGLLGPNGAGKTTTIRMLNTLLLPTSGRARVLGHDVATEPVAVRRRIGYVFGGDRGLYDRLSAQDNLRYFAELYGVDPREQRARIGELLDLVGLAGREQDRVEGYSRGMRQRLHLARGLLHRPDVLFLDEPSIGVDPVAARDLRRLIADLKQQGTTILLTTHYMAEADELCDRIAVIAHGELRALGTPAALKAEVSGVGVIEIEVFGIDEARVAEIRSLPGVREVTVREDGPRQWLSVQSHDSAPDPEQDLRRTLADLRLGRTVRREPTLEDAYVSIVSGAAAPQPAAVAA